MIEWIVIVGLVVAMYILIYKYEKKMTLLEKKVYENKSKLDEHDDRINKNHERIGDNHSKLKEHDNHIDQMWITLPKGKNKDN